MNQIAHLCFKEPLL